jgi:hypothetical protein
MTLSAQRQKSQQIPFFSQSPYRVGSSPFGPPCSSEVAAGPGAGSGGLGDR